MALWMNLGTINVVNGSKAVTGVGTKFKTAPIPAREGQPIVINNVHYEIGSVNSDTSITLALNYASTTANNLPYTIITTAEGSFNDLSRRAAQVMSLYQGYMDVYDALFSGTGNVTVTLPDGDVVTLPAWNTMQPKDSTLTSLSGKPVKTFGMDRLNDETKDATLTALGASTFGKARLADGDAAAARTALQLKKASQVDILGTVTSPDAAGLTGAIFQRGSNANGEYVKFADGTMMCDALVAYPTTGPVDGFLVTYPAAFASVRGINASVTAFLTSTSNTAAFIVEVQGVSASQFRVKPTRDVAGALSAPTTPVTIACRAYGRWF